MIPTVADTLLPIQTRVVAYIGRPIPRARRQHDHGASSTWTTLVRRLHMVQYNIKQYNIQIHVRAQTKNT